MGGVLHRARLAVDGSHLVGVGESVECRTQARSQGAWLGRHMERTSETPKGTKDPTGTTLLRRSDSTCVNQIGLHPNECECFRAPAFIEDQNYPILSPHFGQKLNVARSRFSRSG